MNQLEDKLAGLATLEVPVRVDAGLTVRAGRRVVHRRRAAAAAGVTSLGVVALAVAPSVVRSVAPGQTDPALTPADIASNPSSPARAWQWADIAHEANATGRPGPSRELRLARVVAAAGSGYRYLSGGEGSGEGEIVGSLALIQGNAAGHVSLVIRQEAAGACTTPLHPYGGTGHTCTPGTDDRGDYAVVEWADSGQGPTRMVRVRHNGWAAMLTVSLGHPTYPAAADEPTLLPWDLRDPFQPESASGNPRTEHPRLDAYPFSVAAQTDLAWSYLGSWSD